MTPDFIIIGAMKCGTTTLAAQLATQPGIFVTTPKEPNYFSDDHVFAKGPDWYAAQFVEAEENALRGEASTHYTKLPTYPGTVTRIRAAMEGKAPPRLIYMIRNPLDRAVSHYIHEWSQGTLGADPEQAFRSDSTLIDYGRYGMQLTPYIKAFGREAVHLTSLEQMRGDPQRTLAEIGRFLGRADLVWQEDLGAQNVSAERVRPLPFHGLLVENPVARALRRALVPKALRTRIRAARSMKTRPQVPEDLMARLAEVYRADRELLAESFPRHPALDLCYPFAHGFGAR